MNKSFIETIKLLILCAIISTVQTVRAQTATWNGGGGDGQWNTGLNWDLGEPPAGINTNAVIGAGNTVNYDQPMAALNFGALTLNGVLNINTNGFVAASNGVAISVPVNGARLFINNGGVVSVPNGGLNILGNLGSVIMNPGSSLSVQGALNVGVATTATFTNNGGNLSAGSTSVNANNASAGTSCLMIIAGGVNDLGNVLVRRAIPSSQPALGTEGLVISNGLVRMTAFQTTGNSFVSVLVTGGIVTNTGEFTVGRQDGNNNRQSRYI